MMPNFFGGIFFRTSESAVDAISPALPAEAEAMGTPSRPTQPTQES